MGEILFIGLGLDSEEGITLKGLKAARKCDEIFVELYTSLMPNINLTHLKKLLGKSFKILSRRDLEDNMDKILEKAKKKCIALLTPGDPFIATTHIALRIEAERHGIRTRVINGVSIISAIPSVTGLQSYKFGKSVTLTFPDEGYYPEAVYDVTKMNLEHGLHTLILLDIRVEEERLMTIREGILLLEDMERKRCEGVFRDDRLAVGVARVGSSDMVVKADYLCRLVNHEFGDPPHSIVIPGNLHFMEAEALVTLADAPREIIRKVRTCKSSI